MSKNAILRACLLGALVCAGCSSGDGQTGGSGFEALLQGTWKTTCAQVDATTYQTATVTFTGSSFTQVAAAYSSAACDTPIATNDFTATFVVGSAVTATVGSTSVTAFELDHTQTGRPTVYDISYVDTSMSPHRLHVGLPTGENDGTTPARRITVLSTWFLERQ